jgi:hypothetical protein
MEIADEGNVVEIWKNNLEESIKFNVRILIVEKVGELIL